VEVSLVVGTTQPAPAAAPPAPGFAFPADAAGQATARAVTPKPPAPLPTERLGDAPRPRTPPARVVDPDSLVKLTLKPPPVLPDRPDGAAPAAPPERVPVGLGVGAEGVPQRPPMPAAPVETPRARDVKLPPELPPLARQLPDRAGLDDPTADAGNADVVARSVAVRLAAAAFLRVTLPDPFELADQVRPAVPPAAEPGRAVVPVDPRRPK
jgi:hypothetical protein